ncbi:DMT family transporter [Sinorhizobium sp. 8-89]|uniref:DMT family transporter n=1 Tax=Sinorhizobium sp. 7-81 TaxID=3049087 RepID=UPI0024C35596|nr:DMT family transporter [Sinorhizobium sp. 7-81]MDK1388022.1 DMT family transporter [Sinorhizobium sp. 7-81]
MNEYVPTAAAPHNTVMRGVAIMLFAMLILPCMDAIAKYMAVYEGMSPGQVTFYRFFFQLVSTAPLLLSAGGVRAFYPKRLWPNILRGVLLAAAALFFFVSVKYMPLADVFAIYFVEPFILTCLSALILREKVGWRRWSAIAVGFGGAMVVIQPSFAIFGLTSLLPVACAFLFACYLFLNRAVGNADPPLTMQTVAGIGGTLFMAAVIAFGNGMGAVDFEPSLPQSALGWVLVVALGAISGWGHLLVVKAFQAAPISLLAPFHYFEIVSATALGYIVFEDFPTPSKWLGILVIVASGLYIIWRERMAQRRKSA